MKQADEITLKAFLIALSEINEPLSETELAQLETVANDVENNLGKLDKIAENNPKLDTIYQKIRILLQDGYTKRNKGGFPQIDESKEQNNTEVANLTFISTATDDLSETSQSILNMESKTLVAKIRSLLARS